MTKHIIPRYKLMLFYDLKPHEMDAYYDFIMNEMIPTAQQMDLYIFRVFHTLYGDGPLRQAEFVAENLATLRQVMDSDTWHGLEDKLMRYTVNYNKKIVKFRPGFQL